MNQVNFQVPYRGWMTFIDYCDVSNLAFKIWILPDKYG